MVGRSAATSFVSLLWLLAVGSCGSGDAAKTPECPVGSRHCPCTSRGACDAGLTCIDEMCLQMDAAQAGSSGTASFAAGSAGLPAAAGTAGQGGAAGASGAGGAPAEAGAGGVLLVPRCEPGEPRHVEGNFWQELDDLPDCKTGCTNRYDRSPFEIEIPADAAGTEILVHGEPYDGIIGAIDGELHSPGSVPDLDFVRVVVAPRTVVEVTVEPMQAPACIDPFVAQFDPALAGAPTHWGYMVENNDRAAGDISARILAVSPVAEDEPWFIVVDDARNALADGSVGGDAFAYVARFRRLGTVKFQKLTPQPPGETTTVTGELREAGGLQFYRFADPDERSHRVRFTTDNPAFCGAVWQLNLADGRVSWITTGGSALSETGECESAVQFDTNPLVAGDGGDYGLVVTDARGRGSNSDHGAFSYRLSLTTAL
ncbi:MAG: hypothetical protein JW940_22525 [Polyangiaceae bacterium]|nr:hypothetical protein [Polyangiaceae bacterium]